MLIPDIFLFTHPPKCGGTSFRSVLRDHFYRKLDYKIAECEPAHCGHWGIAQWLDFSDNLPPVIISCIRNPWDRAVSFWYHLRTHRRYVKTFEDFMKTPSRYESGRFQLGYGEFIERNDARKCMVHDGKFYPTFVIRLEHYEDDLQEAVKLLGISDPKVRHERHRTQRPLNDDYRNHYNDELISIVENSSRWEIEKFGYKF